MGRRIVTRVPPSVGPSRRAALLGIAAATTTTTAAVFGAGRASAGGTGAVSVFAAISLRPALDAIAAGWDGPVRVTYGGSGQIARQVAAGAPADVVVLAAADWMDWLAARGHLDGAPVPVAANALVLAGPTGSGPLGLTPAALDARLGRGRFAMGDPASVPAGRYARAALRDLGLWPVLADRLLLAENVRAALAYVARGDVPLGCVYATDLAGTGAVAVARIPPDAHPPIVYPAAATHRGGPAAAAFLAHLRAAAATFDAHGFARAPAA